MREFKIKRAADAAARRFGKVDVLLNTASRLTGGTVETVTAEDFTAAMNLLLGAAVFGIRNAAQVMRAVAQRHHQQRQRGGEHARLNEYSTPSLDRRGTCDANGQDGVRPSRRDGQLDLAGRHRHADLLWRFGCRQPGHTAAKLGKLKANFAKATPLRRFRLPRDNAAAALFLASDKGAFVNCHDLMVDSGMTAGGCSTYEGCWEQRNSMQHLAGKAAVVTGAASGVSRSMAEAFGTEDTKPVPACACAILLAGSGSVAEDDGGTSPEQDITSDSFTLAYLSPDFHSLTLCNAWLARALHCSPGNMNKGLNS